MLALIALVYLLLAVRVRIAAEASIAGTSGSVHLWAGAGGVFLRYDGSIQWNEETKRLELIALNERAARKKKKEKRSTRRGKIWNNVVRAGKMEALSLDLRIGLWDAAETALAAGCVRAMAAAVFQRLGDKAICSMNVVPDFERACFAAQGRCIFSCQGGDIILAACRAALKKNGKEGFGWKSIPLKA